MNRGCVSAWSHDCQLVYCLVTTRVAYITAGYWLQPALAATAATLGVHYYADSTTNERQPSVLWCLFISGILHPIATHPSFFIRS